MSINCVWRLACVVGARVPDHQLLVICHRAKQRFVQQVPCDILSTTFLHLNLFSFPSHFSCLVLYSIKYSQLTNLNFNQGNGVYFNYRGFEVRILQNIRHGDRIAIYSFLCTYLIVVLVPYGCTNIDVELFTKGLFCFSDFLWCSDYSLVPWWSDMRGSTI